MKKPLFLYGFCVLLVGTWSIIQFSAGVFSLLAIYIFLALVSLYLSGIHFVSNIQRNSANPLLSVGLGVVWFALAIFLLLLIGGSIGFRMPILLEYQIWILLYFSRSFYLPFLIIWLFLFGLISTSFILKKPFWLVESKKSYLPLIGILILFYIFVGFRVSYKTTKQSNEFLRYSNNSQELKK